MKKFPGAARPVRLSQTDVTLYLNVLKDQALRLLPTAKDCFFLPGWQDYQNLCTSQGGAADSKKYQWLTQLPFRHQSISDVLVFSLEGTLQNYLFYVTGLDPLFLQKAEKNWLETIFKELQQGLLDHSRLRSDQLTGLPDLSACQEMLSQCSGSSLQLLLVFLPARRSQPAAIQRHLQRSTSILLQNVQPYFTVFYLGNSIFALLRQISAEVAPGEIEGPLVQLLRREGWHRVHIGGTVAQAPRNSCAISEILDQAWTALDHAQRRGPASYYDFRRLARPQDHPLAALSKTDEQRLHRIVKGMDQFTLVRFSAGGNGALPSSIVAGALQKEKSLAVGEDWLVVFSSKNVAELRQRVQEMIEDLYQRHGQSLSAGICSYPLLDYSKKDIAVNCKKALHHGDFLGARQVVVFNHLSLNVSGDIYFADGDLNTAVKEYRRGLLQSGGEVNLHNSLGVTLAMMDRLRAAKEQFRAALALDSKNFMAHYNLALGLQATGQSEDALACLLSAWDCMTDEQNGQRMELTLQIGILLATTGKTLEALDWLQPWLLENPGHPSVGKVHFQIGKAHHAMGNGRLAMAALQRALRYDEMNPEAIHLLGELYLQEGEGGEVAYALAAKSVELEPGNSRYLLGYARSLVACGRFEEAKPVVERCLKSSVMRPKAYLVRAEMEGAMNNLTKALHSYKKIKELKNIDRSLQEAAIAGERACRKKLASSNTRKEKT